MKKLNMRQYNNLIVGNTLLAEFSPTLPDHRAYITVRAYTPPLHPYKGNKVSKTLNRSLDDLRFKIEKYEVSIAILQSWQSNKEGYKNYICKDNISTIEELEMELEKFLQDFSLLSDGSDPTPRPEGK